MTCCRGCAINWARISNGLWHFGTVCIGLPRSYQCSPYSCFSLVPNYLAYALKRITQRGEARVAALLGRVANVTASAEPGDAEYTFLPASVTMCLSVFLFALMKFARR